jgi:membrane protease YdiL (CAAX protease family)
MIVPFVLLALATCTVWLPPVGMRGPRIHAWLFLLLIASAWAEVAGIIGAAGLATLAALLGVAWTARGAGARVRGGLLALVAIGSLALSLHVVPGVGIARWAPVRLTPDAVAFTPGLNFGKASAGLVLFALVAPRLAAWAELRPIWKPTIGVAAIGTCVTVGAAIAMGYTRFEPKLPPETAVFLLANLFFTCVAEESFFRGLVQEEMHRAAERARMCWLHVAAVPLSAVVFGAAHAAGGMQYVLLATLGGFANALAYARARKVEASIFTHFALNATHFIFFTYPALVR